MSSFSASTDDSRGEASSSPGAVVAALLRATGARAAGLWRVEGGCLVQAAFVACPEMPAEVARAFADATRSVALTEVPLGIVSAAVSGVPRVSRAEELPSNSGSGRWLRAFGAERSIAVPLRGAADTVIAVLSVALPSSRLNDDEVAEQVRAAGRSWKP